MKAMAAEPMIDAISTQAGRSLRIGIDMGQLRSQLRTGLYWYTRNLVEGLHELDAKHTIWLFMHRAKKAELSALRSSFPRFRPGSFDFPGFPYRLRLRFCAANRVDVFQYMTAATIPISRYRRNAFLIPDLTTKLFPEWHTPEQCRYWEGLLEQTHANADLILTFSEHTKQEVCTRLSIVAEKVRAVPLAAAADFAPLPETRLLPHLQRWDLQSGKYVLSVGAIEPRKNHLTLVRAFARLRQDASFADYRLVLAGPKGWLYDEVFEAIRQLGLDGHVVWLGHVDQLAALYCGAAVMVYPSFYEGFGLPPLEAMACGTPVISSNTSSLPEVVGDAGIMIDPRDELGLAESLAEVLSDPERRQQMRIRGLAQAAKFSWRRTASETLAAYEQLCSS